MDTLGNAFFSFEIINEIVSKAQNSYFEIDIITGKEHFHRAIDTFKRIKNLYFKTENIILNDKEINLPKEKKVLSELIGFVSSNLIDDAIRKDFNFKYEIDNISKLYKYFYSLPLYHSISEFYKVTKLQNSKEELFQNKNGCNEHVLKYSYYGELQRLELHKKDWYKEYISMKN